MPWTPKSWRSEVNPLGPPASGPATSLSGPAITAEFTAAKGYVDEHVGVSVLSWGAKGDGFTDDTIAIQNAADAVTAINGQLVFPSGYTFMVNPAANDGNNMIIGLDGACEIRIEKGATVKVMPSATAYGGVFGNNGVNNDMTGVRFLGGGTIDGNKATRVAAAVVPDSTHWCGAISLGIGSHQKVLGLRFTNFDCVWVVAGSANNVGNASDCEVAYCQFDNLGNTIPAQKHDHSAIYLDAIGMSVHHNTFWQGNPGGEASLLGGSAPAFVTNYGVRTAIECHGSGQHVHHNRTFGIQWGGQLQASSVSWLNQDASGSYNSVGVGWHDNHFLHCAVGIQVGPYGLSGGNYYGLDGVEVHSNTISVNPAIWNVDTGGGLLMNGIVMPSSIQTGSVVRLGIHDNNFSITPNNSALNAFALSVGAGSNPSVISLQMVGTNVVQDWTIANNKIFGALYHGVLVTATNVTGLKVVGNTIRDIGLYTASSAYPIVVESSGGSILDSDVTNNTAIDDQTVSNHPWGRTAHTINGSIVFTSGVTQTSSYRIYDNYGRCADGASLAQTAGWSGVPAPVIAITGLSLPLNPMSYGAQFDGVTDDTTAWTATIAALPAKGGEIYVPPSGTSIITQIALPINSTDVVIRGGGSENGNLASCRLLSHYTGSGAVFSAQAAVGLRISGLRIENDSSSFTGPLVDMSRAAGTQDTSQFDLSDMRLQAVSQAGSTVRLLKLTKATVGRLQGVYGFGGAYAVEGLVTAGDYCNSVTVGEGCTFSSQDLAAIHNLGNGCIVTGATFEPLRSGTAGAYLQDAAVPCPGVLSWLANWTGDGNGSGSWIIFNGTALYVFGGLLDTATDGIKLNATTRVLTASLQFNGQTNAFNLNGQTLNVFNPHGSFYTSTTNVVAGASAGVGMGGGGFTGGPAAVQTVLTGTKALTSNTPVALSFDAITYDTLVDGARHPQWVIGSPTRLTSQVSGLYRMYASVVFAANATGQRAVWFRVNGSTWLPGTQVNATAAGATDINVSSTYQLQPGDYVECWVQSAGASINALVSDGSLGMPTVFGMERIS